MSLQAVERTTNFVNGVSYNMSALQTLRIVMTSMIAGEAQYYRPRSSYLKVKNSDESEGINDMYKNKQNDQQINQQINQQNTQQIDQQINQQIDQRIDQRIDQQNTRQNIKQNIKQINKHNEKYVSTLNIDKSPVCKIKIDNKSKDFKQHFLFSELYSENTNNDINTYLSNIIDNALDEDYEGCLNLIPKLRDEYMMRLNPQILLVSAILHNNRIKFNKSHPKVMKQVIMDASILPTDMCKQYELLKRSGIDNPPSIWKRSIAEKLENMSRYHAIKYINGSKTCNKSNIIESKFALTNLVDLVRITHPSGKSGSVIEELVKTGKVVSLDLEEDTWERLRSAGKTWSDILSQIKIPHMALLRNLRNICQEYSSYEGDRSNDIKKIGEQLINGVIGGKQFPFRYFSAYRSLEENENVLNNRSEISRRYFDGKKDTLYYNKSNKSSITTKSNITSKSDKSNILMNSTYINIINDALEKCLQLSLSIIPQLEGRVDCLTDNSGSAHGAFVSEYGSVKVSEISNLSAILTVLRATEGGSVWIFGDNLVEFKVDKEKSILSQLDEVNQIGSKIGWGTESGIWLFWDKMINKKIHLDTVFIYSDQQAGYGGLYANATYKNKIKKYIPHNNQYHTHCYVDVLQLVNTYRENVNSKMNIFTVQVAGYNNSILPSILYRGAVLSGWTGKEAKMAYEMIKVWNEIESNE